MNRVEINKLEEEVNRMSEEFADLSFTNEFAKDISALCNASDWYAKADYADEHGLSDSPLDLLTAKHDFLVSFNVFFNKYSKLFEVKK